jgi:uncharacterized membrane protein
MDLIYKILLGLHVVGGFTSLCVGIAAYIATKGGKYHKIAGRIYFGGMIAVVVSAISMNYFKTNIFLFYIAIFTLYQVWGGLRSVKDKNLQPKWQDVTLFFIGLTTAFLMIYSLQIVLVSFGTLFISLLYGDLKIYLLIKRKLEVPKNQWLLRHIGLMSGSYIATSTAFLTVNFQHMNPFWLPWLVPSMIGVPLIAYYQRRISKPKTSKA